MAELTWEELEDYNARWVTAEHAANHDGVAHLDAGLERVDLAAFTSAIARAAAYGDPGDRPRRAGQLEILRREWIRRGFRTEGEAIILEASKPAPNAKELAHASGNQ